MEVREYLWCLELDFDVDAQLDAIRESLRQHQQAKIELSQKLLQIETRAQQLAGVRSERAAEAYDDHAHHSVYQAAAHSMAALGMLAPLTETIFYQCFRSIGDKFFAVTFPRIEHARWKSAYSYQWDCHYVMKGEHREKDLVKGILQLADAIGLLNRLPNNLEKILSLLFGYRNEMFHNGFEWPLEVRQRFEKRANEKGWPQHWISKASADEKPWIFCLSDDYIEEYLVTLDQVLDAIGGFVRDELLPGRAPAGPR